MRPNIGRWLRNTIALPACAGHLTPANNASAFPAQRSLQTLISAMEMG